MLIPIRMVNGSSTLRRPSSYCIARPARTARSGSSSRVDETPQTAMIASPMCLSTRPPKSATIASRRAHNAFIVAATTSASSRDDIAVNPLRSANSTVT